MMKSQNEDLRRLTDYFARADILHQHVMETRRVLYSSHVGERLHFAEFVTYLDYWLSSLYVVVEGFTELGLVDAAIEGLIRKNRDYLRIYRNGTFHFQRCYEKQLQFFGGDRLNWAEDLHSEFSRFFGDALSS